MTKLLDMAIEKARRLPPERQDLLAAIIMDEIEAQSERGKKSLGRTRLDALVAEADREIDSGRPVRWSFQVGDKIRYHRRVLAQLSSASGAGTSASSPYICVVEAKCCASGAAV
jgi:hypothetical protein